MNIRLGHLALVLAAGLTCRAWAGFTDAVYLDGTYDVTMPLQGGTVYVVTNSVTFHGSYDGKSGLAVAPNAQVVIFVKENAWLHAVGRKGDTGGAGGGAGIICPESSTLVITGPGRVWAEGGNGTSGGDMNSPDNHYGYIDSDKEEARAYKGGDGGEGGAGGGAGIGGAGGNGGNAGTAPQESPRTMDGDTYNKNGTRGADGGAGGDGGSAGTVWLIGTAQLQVSSGDGGNGGGGVANPIVGTRYENPNPFGDDFCVGGARPGGAGAGGMAAVAGIGGGGAGGGGGGSGGNGGYYSWYAESNPSEDSLPSGGRGFGGKSENGEADGAQKQNSMGPVTYKGISGGTGGDGGAAGRSGTGGKLYKSPASSFEGSVARGNIEETPMVPAWVGYRISFNGGGSDEVEDEFTVLGVALGFTGAQVPKMFGKTFQGWYTGEGGTGVKWFNADGSLADAPDVYDTVGDTTLYAKWDDIPDFNPEDYRLEAAGIEIGETSITIPVVGKTAGSRDYALDFVKVHVSETLPVPENAPVRFFNIKTDGGEKAIVVPRDADADTMFYRIDVGD